MGFIIDNTNTFEVYLTDLGKQKFFDGGFKDAIKYFSMCDGDNNYEIFVTNPNNILSYNGSTTYYNGNVVKYNGGYYKYKGASNSGNLPTNTAYWDKVILFNPTIIDVQAIPTINHNGTRKTSLGNENSLNDDYINDVFTQTPLRGKVSDNNEYRRALLGTRQTTQRDYVMQEPDINTNQTVNVLTYINI